MASCRTGRIPLPSDPLCSAHEMSVIRPQTTIMFIGLAFASSMWWWRMNHPHTFVTYKGPDNPFTRIRHRRFPAGGVFYGWGNNGLNRDCNLKEYECWAGYVGKEYTY